MHPVAHTTRGTRHLIQAQEVQVLRAREEVDPAKDFIGSVLFAVQASPSLVPRILHARMRTVEPAFVVLLVQLAVDADEHVFDNERAAVLARPDSHVPVVARMRSLEMEDA